MNKLLVSLVCVALLFFAMAAATKVEFSPFTPDPSEAGDILSLTFAVSTVDYLSSGPDNYLPAITAIGVTEATFVISEAFYNAWDAANTADPTTSVSVTYTQTIGNVVENTEVFVNFDDLINDNTIVIAATDLLPLAQSLNFADVFVSDALFYNVVVTVKVVLLDPAVDDAVKFEGFEILSPLVSKGATIAPAINTPFAIKSSKFSAISETDYLAADPITDPFSVPFDVTLTFGTDLNVVLRNDDAVEEGSRAVLALLCEYAVVADADAKWSATSFFELAAGAGAPAHFPRGTGYADSPEYLFDDVVLAVPASFVDGHAVILPQYQVSIFCKPYSATLSELDGLVDPAERQDKFKIVSTKNLQKTITFRNVDYVGLKAINVPEVVYVNNGKPLSLEITLPVGSRAAQTLLPPVDAVFKAFYTISDSIGDVSVTSSLVPPTSQLVADAQQNVITYSFVIPELVDKTAPLTADSTEVTALFVLMPGDATEVDEDTAIASFEADITLQNALLLPAVTFDATIEAAPVQWGSFVQTLTTSFTKETDAEELDMSAIVFRFKLHPDSTNQDSFIYRDVQLPIIPADNTEPTVVETTFEWSFATVGDEWKTDKLAEADTTFFAAAPTSSLSQVEFSDVYQLITLGKFSVEAIATIEETETTKSLFTSNTISPVVYTVSTTDDSCEVTEPAAVVCALYDGKTTNAETCNIAAITDGKFVFTPTTDEECVDNINLTPAPAGENCYTGTDATAVECNGRGTCDDDDQCACSIGWETDNGKECFYPSDVLPVAITKLTFTPTKVTSAAATLFTTAITTGADGLKTYRVTPGAFSTLDQGEAYNWEITADIATAYYPIETDLQLSVKLVVGVIEYATVALTYTAVEVAAAKGLDGLYTFKSTTPLTISATAAASAQIVPVITVTADEEVVIKYTSTSGAAAGSPESLVMLSTATYAWDVKTVCSSEWCGDQGVGTNTYECFMTVGVSDPVELADTDADFPKCAILVDEDKSAQVPPVSTESCLLPLTSIKVCFNGGECNVGTFIPATDETDASVSSVCKCDNFSGTFCETQKDNSAAGLAAGFTVFASIAIALLF